MYDLKRGKAVVMTASRMMKCGLYLLYGEAVWQKPSSTTKPSASVDRDRSEEGEATRAAALMSQRS